MNALICIDNRMSGFYKTRNKKILLNMKTKKSALWCVLSVVLWKAQPELRACKSESRTQN